MLHNNSKVSQKGSLLIFFGLVLLLAVMLGAFAIPTANAQSADNFCAAGEVPEFRFGFAAYRQQMGAMVGEPVECEHYDEQGNAYQKTTTGLLFYNQSTGQITFTPNTRLFHFEIDCRNVNISHERGGDGAMGRGGDTSDMDFGI